MSPVDWDAMVADLSSRRTEVAQELEDLDAVLATVRKRAGASAIVAAPRPPKKGGRKKPRANAQRPKPSIAPAAPSGRATPGKLTDTQIATMRAQYEGGTSAEKLAERFHVHFTTVYAKAKAGNWKRPGATKPAPTPKGEQLAGSVKCTNPDCGVMTDYDPCRRCGRKLDRKGW